MIRLASWPRSSPASAPPPRHWRRTLLAVDVGEEQPAPVGELIGVAVAVLVLTLLFRSVVVAVLTAGAIVVVAAVTVMPALLGMAGRRVLGRRDRHLAGGDSAAAATGSSPGFAARWTACRRARRRGRAWPPSRPRSPVPPATRRP